MSPEELSSVEDWKAEALVAFDAALAGGDVPEPSHPLLQNVHDCQRLLEAVWPRSQPAPLALPRRLGRFVLESELGRGGFGIVYLATDTALSRKVALKLPRPELALDEQFRRRFRREGEAASRLDHPHIVPLFEIGQEGDACYIASAYCDGPTLSAWLRGRTSPATPRLAAEIVAKLALAVGHAHDRGVLHRDLKPGNVLLPGARPGDEGSLNPRICDFGLAKILDQEGDDTRSGAPLGSPTYMAPEQARARHDEIGPATDVYALGTILYELLVGRPPFQGTSVLEVLAHVTATEPDPPRSLRPGLPRDLDTICRKCLEKRPERRYADGSALAADLARFLAGQPVQARPVPAWVRGVRWGARHPALAVLAVFIALSTVGAIGGLAWTASREREHNNEMRGALDRTQRSEQRAQRLWASGQIRLAQLYYNQGEVETAANLINEIRPIAGQPDPRGFAWSYLDRLCRDQIPQAIHVPNGLVQWAFSPDRRLVALSSRQGELWIWDMSAEAPRRLEGCPGAPSALQFSPDGRTLAASFERTVRLWDVASGLSWQVPACNARVNWFQFEPSGTRLYLLGARKEGHGADLVTWRLSARERLASLDTAAPIEIPSVLRAGRDGLLITGLGGLAATADGQALAVARDETRFDVFELHDAEPTASAWREGDEIAFVPWTIQPRAPSTAEVEHIASIVRQLSGRKVARTVSTESAVHAVDLSSDGRFLAIYASEADELHGALRVLDRADGRTLATYSLSQLTANQGYARFTADSRSLFVTSHLPKALIWRWQGRPEPPVPSGHQGELWGLAYSPDGKTLATSGDDGTIKLWDTATAKLRRTLEGHDSLVASVAYSPDGRMIASASFDCDVRLWDAATGECRAVLKGHNGPVRTIDFSPDGALLASAGSDASIQVWDVASRRRLREPLRGHASPIYAVAFSPDGRSIVSGGDDRTIRIWDPRHRPRTVRLLVGQRIQALAFAPDGRMLATSSDDGSITLWDVSSQSPFQVFRGHSLEVLALAFSPDGRTLASAGRDTTVRLWDPAIGQEQLTLTGHTQRVHAIAFSADGRTLASGDFGGAVKLWHTTRSDD